MERLNEARTGDIDMSRTRRIEKKTHCKVVGCSICENDLIEAKQNRKYKAKKQQPAENRSGLAG